MANFNYQKFLLEKFETLPFGIVLFQFFAEGMLSFAIGILLYQFLEFHAWWIMLISIIMCSPSIYHIYIKPYKTNTEKDIYSGITSLKELMIRFIKILPSSALLITITGKFIFVFALGILLGRSIHVIGWWLFVITLLCNIPGIYYFFFYKKEALKK